MKKFVILLLLALTTSTGAWAQKGMMGVGARLGLNGGNEEPFTGGELSFQYNLTDRLRLSPVMGYYYAEDASGFDGVILAKIDWFFSSPRPLRPYLFAGAGYVDFHEYDEYQEPYLSGNNLYWRTVYEDSSNGDFGLNGGLGLDWRLSHHLSLQTELGVLLGVSDDDEVAVRFSIGLSYNF